MFRTKVLQGKEYRDFDDVIECMLGGLVCACIRMQQISKFSECTTVFVTTVKSMYSVVFCPNAYHNYGFSLMYFLLQGNVAESENLRTHLVQPEVLDIFQ